jgi:hypothetical protein
MRTSSQATLQKSSTESVNLSGVNEPLHVLAQTKDCRPLRRFVATDAFKYRRAIADCMSKNVELGVIPEDPISVVPNLVRFLYGHNHASLDDLVTTGSQFENKAAVWERQ